MNQPTTMLELQELHAQLIGKGEILIAESRIEEAEALLRPEVAWLSAHPLCDTSAGAKCLVELMHLHCRVLHRLERHDALGSACGEALRIQDLHQLQASQHGKSVRVELLQSRAEALFELGRYSEAECASIEAMEFQDIHRLLDSSEGRMSRVALLMNLAVARRNQGRSAVAEADYTEAIAFQDAHGLLDTHQGQMTRVKLLMRRAVARRSQGRNAEAEADSTEGLAFQDEHRLIDTREGWLLRIGLLTNRATDLGAQGRRNEQEDDWSEAEAAIQKAQRLLDTLKSKRYCVSLLTNRAAGLHTQGRHAEAEAGIAAAMAFQHAHGLLDTHDGRLIHIVLLMNRAAARYAMGRHVDAEADCAEAMAFQDQHGLADAHQGRIRRVMLLMNRAICRLHQGRSAEAEADYTTTIAFQDAHGLLEYHEGRMDRVSLLLKRATARRSQDRRADAEADIDEAMAFQNTHHLLESHRGQMQRVALALTRALVMKDQGCHAESESECTQALAFQQLHGLCGSHEGRMDHVKLLVNRALARQGQGRWAEAETDCTAGIAFQDGQTLLDSHFGQSARTRLLLNRAIALRSQGRHAEAEADCTEAIDLQDARGLLETHDGKMDRLSLLIQRLLNRVKLGKSKSAYADARLATTLLCDLWRDQTSRWSSKVASLESIFARHPTAVESFYGPVANAWLRRISAERNGKTLAREWAELPQFLQRYLAAAVSADRKDLLPRIMAVLHGRKLLEIALSDIDDESVDTGLPSGQVEVRRKLRSLRAEIEAIRMRLGRDAGAGPLDSDFPDGGSNRRSPSFVRSPGSEAVALEARKQREWADETRLESLVLDLEALLQADPNLSRLTGLAALTPATLRERLAPGDGLVTLATVDASSLAAHVLIHGRDDDGIVFRIPELLGHARSLVELTHLPGAASVLRHGAWRDGTPGKPASSPMVQQAVDSTDLLDRHFWTPLLGNAETAGVRRWHVVVTGPLFALPWAESLAGDGECCVHTALPLFLRAEPAGEPPVVPTAMSIHPGPETALIPAVLLEQALLARLWVSKPSCDARQMIEEAIPVGIAHFACHGSHDERDPMGVAADSELTLADPVC